MNRQSRHLELRCQPRLIIIVWSVNEFKSNLIVYVFIQFGVISWVTCSFNKWQLCLPRRKNSSKFLSCASRAMTLQGQLLGCLVILLKWPRGEEPCDSSPPSSSSSGSLKEEIELVLGTKLLLLRWTRSEKFSISHQSNQKVLFLFYPSSIKQHWTSRASETIFKHTCELGI